MLQHARPSHLIFGTLALGLAACGDDEGPIILYPDTGVVLDIGVSDSGLPDGGVSDSGAADTGVFDSGADGGVGALEIIGVYASNYGSEEIITEVRFNGDLIASFDNEANALVSQTSTGASYNPGKFNKIVWTEPSTDSFYYCFVDFGLDTAAAAEASTATADATNPETGGCGGFAWTRLRRASEIRGRYLSSFGGMETITSTIWVQYGSPMGMIDWSDTSNWVVTQNDANAEYYPSLFNKIVYTETSTSGSFYYCTVDYALADADAARSSSMTADATNPETTGCGTFPWTRLDPQ